MTFDDNDIRWIEFKVALTHWGQAARGLCGPKGLGRPDDAEPLPDWSPTDDRMERAISYLRLHYDQGEMRQECLMRFYVHDRGDSGSAALMRVSAAVFQQFRMETERYLYDIWRYQQKNSRKFDKPPDS